MASGLTQDRDGLAPGTVLAGKYRVERILGQGGMGLVVAAEHIELEQKVALKFLLPEVATDTNIVARFLREARAAVRIQSEHVARVMDVGTLENGSPFMVMEHLSGADLSTMVQARGAIPYREAVDYLLQALEAIAEAHSLGIVHRDIKPANLFVTQRPDGTPLVKVLDFGISKVRDAKTTGRSQLTGAADMMGSPQYMSPEQIRSAKMVDTRTDVWALGVTLYEILSARLPFDADSIAGVIAAITLDEPAHLSTIVPDLPSGLDELVMRCLAKSPDARPQSVAQLAQGLGRFVRTRTSHIAIRRISTLLGVPVMPSTQPPPAGSDPPSTDPEYGASTKAADPMPYRIVERPGGSVVVEPSSGGLRAADGLAAQRLPTEAAGTGGGPNRPALAGTAVLPAQVTAGPWSGTSPGARKPRRLSTGVIVVALAVLALPAGFLGASAILKRQPTPPTPVTTTQGVVQPRKDDPPAPTITPTETPSAAAPLASVPPLASGPPAASAPSSAQLPRQPRTQPTTTSTKPTPSAQPTAALPATTAPPPPATTHPAPASSTGGFNGAIDSRH